MLKHSILNVTSFCCQRLFPLTLRQPRFMLALRSRMFLRADPMFCGLTQCFTADSNQSFLPTDAPAHFILPVSIFPRTPDCTCTVRSALAATPARHQIGGLLQSFRPPPLFRPAGSPRADPRNTRNGPNVATQEFQPGCFSCFFTSPPLYSILGRHISPPPRSSERVFSWHYCLRQCSPCSRAHGPGRFSLLTRRYLRRI